MRVQETLTQLNVGQDIILNTGLTLNLVWAAMKVSQGAITPGDFILIQALCGQLAGPLHLVGTVLREADQASVEAEDLYKIMNSKPEITEKEDAVDYEFKGGDIEFENVSFTYNTENHEESDTEMTAPPPKLLNDFSMKIE